MALTLEGTNSFHLFLRPGWGSGVCSGLREGHWIALLRLPLSVSPHRFCGMKTLPLHVEL